MALIFNDCARIDKTAYVRLIVRVLSLLPRCQDVLRASPSQLKAGSAGELDRQRVQTRIDVLDMLPSHPNGPVDLNTLDVTAFELRDCVRQPLKQEMLSTARHNTEIVLLSFEIHDVTAQMPRQPVEEVGPRLRSR